MLIRCIIFCILAAGIYCQDWKSWKPGNWDRCQIGSPTPETVTDTTQRLADLRSKLIEENIGAYIVPSGDFHLSEFVSDHDKRREYISGFSGSAGTAVITRHFNALWTDGRYFLQAESQLGCNWLLMRDGEEGVPSITEWLGEEMKKDNFDKVGASPNFFGNDEWKKYESELSSHGQTLTAVQSDLIDAIWTNDRPELPSTPIVPQPLKYAGKSWQDKMADIEKEMEKRGVDVLVVTGLDEIAWLFNMRAKDIRGFVNDPFFYSLAIVERGNLVTRLYIKDPSLKLSRTPDDPITNTTVADHLNTQNSGSCVGRTGRCVKVSDYQHIMMFMADIRALATSSDVKKVWLSYHCNYGIYSIIPTNKVLVDNTPAAMMKAMKNDVEVEGMRQSHVRDAAALIRFLAHLEEEVTAGKKWTELDAMAQLSRYRSMQKLARGDSFTAISSVGPNAAINHYFANNVTNREITTHETFLLDSGGQYVDGTTDVTRTLLYREPSDFEKECYTRVLMGQIDLALAKWSKGLFGREIDAFARKPLWDVGLVYRHGTGHGIGAYLSVHEGPGRISNHHARFPWDVPLDKHMFFSDEPGYYQAGEFGIRLENIIFVKEVETKYIFPGATMLGFETVTLVPYETHLIDYSLLTDDEIVWLNNYNRECLDKVGPLLKEQRDERALKWLEKRTKAVSNKTVNSGISASVQLSVIFISLVLAVCHNGLYC